MTTHQPIPRDFADPSWLPQALDPVARLVRLVKLSERAYRDASFLDDRLFQHSMESSLCALDDLVAGTDPAMPVDARWIFHIGHVGSTLIARLIGELTLCVREPRFLRDLAGAFSSFGPEVSVTIGRLLSRRFAGGGPTVVKATSFVSEIAPQLCPRGERALFLFASPRNYICSILAGENSRKELAMLAEPRAQRAAGRAVFTQAQASEAHLAAAAWACEMTSLEAAAAAMPDRLIHWGDFDVMLADMARALGHLARFFGLEADASSIRAIAAGPLMGRYSKAMEYEYSPALRAELLEEAERDHRPAIEAAMDMLAKAADEAPLLARALSRASAAREA